MLKIFRWYFLHKAREARRVYFYYKDYPEESFGKARSRLAFAVGTFYRELVRAVVKS
jgi:hypothetical protein